MQVFEAPEVARFTFYGFNLSFLPCLGVESGIAGCGKAGGSLWGWFRLADLCLASGEAAAGGSLSPCSHKTVDLPHFLRPSSQ